MLIDAHRCSCWITGYILPLLQFSEQTKGSGNWLLSTTKTSRSTKQVWGASRQNLSVQDCSTMAGGFNGKQADASKGPKEKHLQGFRCSSSNCHILLDFIIADAMICRAIDRRGPVRTKLLGLQNFSWTAANGSRTEAIPRLPGSSMLMRLDNQQCQVCALKSMIRSFETGSLT